MQRHTWRVSVFCAIVALLSGSRAVDKGTHRAAEESTKVGKRQRWARFVGGVAVLLAVVSLPTSATAAPPALPHCASVTFTAFQMSVPPFPDSPDHRYFPETRHSLNWGFKTFWERNGGLPIFGFPVEEEHQEAIPNDPRGGARTVQRFERARFEYHPEFKGTPYEVELGLLGREATAGRTGEQPFQPATPIVPSKGIPARYYPETGHNLSAPFVFFWDANGGLSIFGYPMSESFPVSEADPTTGVAETYTVQYFERVRMEFHPEKAYGTVVLGRLGDDVGALCFDDATGAARTLHPWDR